MYKPDLPKWTVTLSVILFVAIIGAPSVSAQSTDGSVAVAPAEVSLNEDESQTVEVTYERVSDATLLGIEYTLVYDSEVISVIDQEQGSYLAGNVISNNISEPGEVEYAEVIVDGDGVETPSGTIATITIEPVSNVDESGTTDIEFSTVKASEGTTELAVTTSNGTVETSGTQTDDSVDSNSQDTAENTDKQSKESDSDTTEESDGSENGTDNAVETAQNETTEDTDEQSQASDGDTIEEANSSASAEDSTVETTANETDDSTTESNSESEADTNESIPGFGVIITVLSVLTFVYVIRSKGSL